MPNEASVPRRRHREMLVVACIVIAAAPLLTVLPNDRVALRPAPELVLPPSCPSKVIWGVSCPGCGLTRSFVHLAHSDWYASLRAHRVGWILLAAIVLQIPYRLSALRGRPLIGRRAAAWCAYLLIAMLIGNWLVEQIAGAFSHRTP